MTYALSSAAGDSRTHTPWKIAATVATLSDLGVPAARVLEGTGLTEQALHDGATRTSLHQLLRVCGNALELAPENADALQELATLLRVLRRFDEALVLFRRLEQRVPDDPRIPADIGRCLSGLRRFKSLPSTCRSCKSRWPRRSPRRTPACSPQRRRRTGRQTRR